MNDVYIYKIIRVPSGKKGGAYKFIPPEELGSFLLNELNDSVNLRVNLNGELILANSIGTMGNMARNCHLRSKLSTEIVSTTLDLQCGGAYKAIEIAVAQIVSGQRDWVIAGGIESNSLQAERNYHINDLRRKDDKSKGTADFAPYPTKSLKKSAEDLATKYKISKEKLLDWTLLSHKKALKSYKKGLFQSYVLPFNESLKEDESIKRKLSKLLLQKAQTNNFIDRTNTADFHDGAGVVLLANKKFGIDNDIKPNALIRQIEFIGVHPDQSPEGALLAGKRMFENVNQSKFDLFEICESYGVKPLAFAKEFDVSLDKINVFGSNLAMGHPFAASGVINILNLLLALKERKLDLGFVSAGIAGGLGVSMAIERIK
jgi:acetyl-CoA C-acetyltransferase